MKGDAAVQTHDLDQTVIGNPAHDLVRLALSLAGAARGFDLPGSSTARMIEQMVGTYQGALTARRRETDDFPPTIKGLIRQSRRRPWRHLALERIGYATPVIPLGNHFWPLDPEDRDARAALVDTEEVRTLVTALVSRPNGAPVSFVDAAYRVKGYSSLGLLRYRHSARC